MATSLSVPQQITLFSVLEVSYDGSVSRPEGNFNLNYREYEPSSAEEKLQIRILERLDALGAEEENYLVQQLNQWQIAVLTTASVDGSVGGVNGVTYDPEVQLSRIRANILIVIPVYKYQNEISLYEEERKSAGSNFWVPGVR